jgi:hypothetical protein
MASLIDKRVNDVGPSGQNTSPDAAKIHSTNKKATCEAIFEVALRWKPEMCAAERNCTAVLKKKRARGPFFTYL